MFVLGIVAKGKRMSLIGSLPGLIGALPAAILEILSNRRKEAWMGYGKCDSGFEMRKIILLPRYTMEVGTKRGFAWVVRRFPQATGAYALLHRYEGITLPVATARLNHERKETTTYVLEDRQIPKPTCLLETSSREFLPPHFLEVEFFHL